VRTFTIGRKTYPQYVPAITDASSIALNGGATLFSYTKRRIYGTLGVFIRLAEGSVYCATRGMNIIDDYGCNDAVRRAWCQAAGVPWKAFREALKKERAKNSAEQNSAKLHSLRSSAQRLGYKLIRSNT